MTSRRPDRGRPRAQPAIPPGGLLGPDGLIPWGRFPGYEPPPDYTHPWDVPLDPGFHLPIGPGLGPPGMMIAYAPWWPEPEPEEPPHGPWGDPDDGLFGGQGPKQMGSKTPRPWIDFDPTMPCTFPDLWGMIGNEEEKPDASDMPDIPGFRTIEFSDAGEFEWQRRDTEYFARYGKHLQKYRQVRTTGVPAPNKRQRLEQSGWHYDAEAKGYVHHSEGSELHYGNASGKHVNKSSGMTHSVESKNEGFNWKKAIITAIAVVAVVAITALVVMFAVAAAPAVAAAVTAGFWIAAEYTLIGIAIAAEAYAAISAFTAPVLASEAGGGFVVSGTGLGLGAWAVIKWLGKQLWYVLTNRTFWESWIQYSGAGEPEPEPEGWSNYT